MTQKCLLFSSLLVLSSFSLQAQQDSSVYRLLWEITGNNLSQPSYLFGSMHVRDEMAFRFPDSLFLFLERCDVFANEIHMDSAMDKTIALLMNPDFYTDYLEESWNYEEDSLLAMELQLDSLLLDSTAFEMHLLPVEDSTSIAPVVEQEPFSEIIAGLFRKAKKKRPTYLDAYLMQIAKQQGKELQGLENIDEHLELLKSDFYLNGNRDFTNLFGELSNYRALLKVYEKGNIDVMLPYISDKEKKDLQLIERNHIMLATMVRIMQEKSLFAVVGAAHLPGAEGLVELLRQNGYQLRPIARNEATVDGSAWYDASAAVTWNTYRDTTYRYQVEMPCTVQTFDQQGMRMNMGIDIGRGMIFMATCTDLMPHQKDKLQVNLFSMQGYQVLSKTDTIIGDEKVMDFNLYTSQNDINYFRCRIWEKNQLYYVLYVGAYDKEQLQTDVVEAFLVNLKIDAAASNALTSIKSEAGAFSTSMPQSYIYTKGREDYGYFYSSENTSDIHRYRAYDDSGNYYLLHYKDIPPSSYYSLEEDRLRNALYEIAGLFEIYELTDTLSIEKGGYPGKSGRAVLESGEVLFCQTFLRNNRLYMLAGTSAEAEANNMPLLADFSFLPLKHSPLIHEANYSSKGIKAFFPAPAMNTNSDYYYYDDSYSIDSTSFQIGAIDSLSGLLYYMDWEILPELIKIDTPELYLKEFILTHFGYYTWNDSLIQSETRFIDDSIRIIKDFVLQSSSGQAWKKGRAFLQGRGLVKLLVSGSEESLAQAPVEDFLNSLFLDTSLPFWQEDAGHSKIDTILAYAVTQDTVLMNKIFDVIYEYDIDDSEARKVKEVLFDKQAWMSPDDFMYIQSTLFNRITDQFTLDELVRLYHLYPKNWGLKSNVLYQIAALQTDEAVPIFFELATQESDSLYGSTLLTDLYYQPDSIYSKYIDGLFQFLQSDTYSYDILSILNYRLEYNESDPALLMPHLEQVASLGDKWVSEWIADEMRDSSLVKDKLETLFRLYSLLAVPNENCAQQARSVIDFDLRSNLSGPALSVLVYQMKKTDQAYIKQLLSDSAQFLPTIRLLNASEKLDLVPKKLMDQEKIARAIFMEQFYYEDGSRVNVNLLKKQAVAFRGQTYHVYVYTYTYDYEWDDSEYIAIVGMFPDDPFEKFIDEGLINYSSYEIYEPEKLSEVIDKLVEQMVGW
ncbi:MAG TPA: TraB/GumN family protein [Saprospiraceae bacterium]|nr:TraB/GumN family protein [Saprospiraceae bacterium]HMQ82593.1 TraB/GumN family protein [Saprospiraceae bacterium]